MKKNKHLWAMTGVFAVAVIKELFFKNRKAEVAPSTFGHEQKRFDVLLAGLGSRRLDRLTKLDVLHYRVSRKDSGTVGNRTINLEVSLLRTMLNFAVDDGYATKNVAKEVKNLKEYPKKVRIPEDDQFKRFVAESKKTRFGGQFSAWIHLRFLTGMRPGESCGLKWEDIDFNQELIHVVSRPESPLKKGAEQFIENHPSLKKVLVQWRLDWLKKFHNKAPHDWGFFNPQQPSERALGFKREFETARKKAGIPWLTSYGLRHYFISKAVMEGIDYLTIMAWTSHKSSEMIDKVYGHLHASHKKEQMARIKIG